ncbi:toll-like receptor 4 [Mytilus californianus]|uniref:toll-like receptor 4 n=1 Tax=Mytilus californianus TaxID=6549 RepID=UPI00224638E7|nr:toll-like receptor 4 [Mytilus californianus]
MAFLFILLTVFYLVNSKEHGACDFGNLGQSCKNSTIFIVDCSRSNISTIPLFPLGVHVVNLKFNQIEIIRNGTFQMLQNLTELDLSFNQLVEIERDAFVGLNRLQKLNLQNNTLRYSFLSFPDSVFTSLISLKYLNIKFNNKPAEDNLELLQSEIFDIHVETLETLEIDVLFPVNSTDSGIFPSNITSLKALITGICVITELQENTFDNLKNLDYIDLSSCPIETYRSNVLQYRYIKYLDLSNTQFLSDDVSFFAFMHDINTCALDTLVLSNTVTDYDEVFHHFISTLFKYLFYTEIRELRLSYNSLVKIEWRTDEISSDMAKIDLLHTKTEQHVYNYDIPSTLQTLDLSHNSLIRFAYPMENVVCLNLSHNILSEIEYDVYVNNVGTGVKELDLSFNLITNLAQFTFHQYSSLEKLILNNNEFDDITFDFEHLTDLKLLDLSNNRIKSFNHKSMIILSQLMKNQNFSLNLENNNLQCTCDTINFLRWMQNNLHHFQNNDLYKCQLKDGSVVVLNDLNTSITRLEKQCLSLTGVIVCTSVGIFITCIIIAIKLVYRNRWIVLYYYYLKKSKDLNTSESTELEEGFIYDAFVAYAEDDMKFVHEDCIQNLENDKNLKLCIHHRDFLPGEEITVNITNAIHRSRKTICIITKSFLESYYCMFEFNMAKTEGIYSRKGENTLILVFCEDILPRDLPLVLLELVQRRSYIPYHDDQRGNIEFWERIKEAICGSELEVRMLSISTV